MTTLKSQRINTILYIFLSIFIYIFYFSTGKRNKNILKKDCDLREWKKQSVPLSAVSDLGLILSMMWNPFV
jgi:hypothetical protein